jgi:hypothetical protein
MKKYSVNDRVRVKESGQVGSVVAFEQDTKDNKLERVAVRIDGFQIPCWFNQSEVENE